MKAACDSRDDSPQGGIGRAELLRAYAARGEIGLAAAAGLLGYRRKPPTADPSRLDSDPIETDLEPTPDPPAAASKDLALTPIPFWRLEELEFRDPAPPQPQIARKATSGVENLGRLPGTAAAAPSIVPSARLWPALRARLVSSIPSREVDAEALAELWGRGEPLQAIPFRPLAAWTSRLTVLVDRSRRLIPFWGDQDRLVRALHRRLGRSALHQVEYREGLVWPWRDRVGYHPRPSMLRDTPVLALSDLGQLVDEAASKPWIDLTRERPGALARCVALVLCPPNRWDRKVLRRWEALDWSEPTRAPRPGRAQGEAELMDRAERLLALLSSAARIEPGLLRSVRQLLPASDTDLGAEADAWNHPEVASGFSRYASLSVDARERLQARFVREPETLKRRVVEVLRAWRAGQPEEIWWDEVHSLATSAHLPEGALLPEEIEAAREQWHLLADSLEGDSASASAERKAVEAFARRSLFERQPQAVWQDPELAPVLWKVWKAAWPGDGSPALPAGVGPEILGPAKDPERSWDLLQQGESLRFLPAGERVVGGSPVARLASAHTEVSLEIGASRVGHRLALGQTSLVPLPAAPALLLRTDRSAAVLRPLTRPAWAHSMGRDRYGLWASFRVADAVQRMRWIGPGRFWMGSPEDEPGRYEDEGPRHLETMDAGFWLADTPCTQALWEVISGANPSRFRSPDRPVENVSWRDCQSFFSALNERVPGLGARFPLEVEWEFACRAGTATATYAGPMEILGSRNAPDLDRIAWYGGNSGVDFDLEKGKDSPDWPNKQFPHEKAGTRLVAQKSPNAWGLYDALGNVLEWCQDRWRDSYDAEPEGTERVVRGGSWYDYARYVRAAYRLSHEPSVRNYFLGFRLARGQGALQLGAERHRRRSRPSVQPAKPAWASAGGRDVAGIWASFEIGGIEQRLRWIPAGSFQMGSPETEQGHFESENQHPVTLTRGFWLAETPCTQALWKAVIGKNPSHFQGESRPVEQVSWDNAHEFFQRLEEQVPELSLRLPTEAEWEYACRARTETATYAGDLTIKDHHAPELDEIAWYRDIHGGTHSVGEKAPNPWGLYDMLGNVWEWCQDWYGPYPETAIVDPTGPEKGTRRVVRGGSWSDYAQNVRAAYRLSNEPSGRSSDLGFRLARGQDVLQSGAELRSAERPEGEAGGASWPEAKTE